MKPTDKIRNVGWALSDNIQTLSLDKSQNKYDYVSFMHIFYKVKDFTDLVIHNVTDVHCHIFDKS